MADVHTKAQRSRNMAAIKGKNTKPEMAVRSLLHQMGYRFRVHRKDIPGKPDVAFISRRKAIFVHGCFWHMHDCRYGCVIPATNTAFWQHKRRSNVDRDQKNQELLSAKGWNSLIVWECSIRDENRLKEQLTEFLDRSATSDP